MKGLLETFSDFVLKDRSKTAFSFLDDGANVKASLSYGDIDSRSRGVASHLLKNGVNPGDRVVLVYPPSLDYIVAFLGCLMAGVIAVPVFPPDPSDLNKHVSMFCVIVNSCEAKVALTSSAYNYATKLAGIRSFVNSNKSSTSWPELDWIVTDSIGGDPNFKYEGVSEDKIAFLQYVLCSMFFLPFLVCDGLFVSLDLLLPACIL
jgi:acyl-CoA synthetase (AMP-forming)/AMP-acid ligase II